MRKVEKLTIGYCGYKEPMTEDELEMEILGLENAIKSAELRISTLKQGRQTYRMMKTEIEGAKQNETVNSSSPNKENK